MPKSFLFCLVLAGLLPLLAGCWSESAESRMRKMSQAQAELNKAKAAKAGGTSTDSAGSGGASLPKSVVGTMSVATLPAAASNQNVNPAAVTAPSSALGANATLEQRRARSLENMAKLGRALNAYADGYAGYPVTKVPGAAANPPMSWRVAILPLLGYESLFKQYRPAEPWDSTANKQILAQIPPEYQSPERRDTKTNYLVPLGAGAAFGTGRRLNAGMFEDGPDYTLILVEVDDSQAMEWTRPDDLIVQLAPGDSVRSKLGSLRGDGFFAVLANGRVCRIKPDTDDQALKALFTVCGDDTSLIKDAIQDATAVPVPPPAATVVSSVAGGTPAVTLPAVGNKTTVSAAAPVPSKGVPFSSDDDPASTPTAKGLKPLAPLATKKLAVPSDSELASARATLKELYAEDYKQAKTAQDRRQLAQKLTASSREAGEDHAAAYELLRISRDLSAQNGDLVEALKTLSQLEQRFEIDGPAMRLETLKLVQKSPEGLAKCKDLASEAKLLVTLAKQEDEYDVALEALAIGKGAAKRAGDSELLARVAKTQNWLEAAKRAFDDVTKAEARLIANPNDPQANQIAGTYVCLVKGRWETGLSQLAKASDLKLRFLAKLDLSSSKSPQEVFDLANQYWDLAEQKPDLEKQGLRMRAAYWYAQATKELPDGLEKIKARKRLVEIIDAYGKEETEKATARSDVAAAARVGGIDE
ncbi:MAG: DUF1559 domain-containing protein [Planctomycetales bacterium]|nr:DUF1559 domain-containing protein [Planctomycetales bacterium]